MFYAVSHLSIYLSIYIYICLSVYLSLFICLSSNLKMYNRLYNNSFIQVYAFFCSGLCRPFVATLPLFTDLCGGWLRSGWDFRPADEGRGVISKWLGSKRVFVFTGFHNQTKNYSPHKHKTCAKKSPRRQYIIDITTACDLSLKLSHVVSVKYKNAECVGVLQPFFPFNPKIYFK